MEKKQTQNHVGFLNHRVTVNKKLLNGGSTTVGAVVELGLRERRKLGQWMFFFFCGVCLLLGVFKIFFGGLVGSTIDSSHHVCCCFKLNILFLFLCTFWSFLFGNMFFYLSIFVFVCLKLNLYRNLFRY